ncbi:MAG: peptidoglycan editing factor PgeF [Clostridia bacterium]|nr:peptidoglycan editing factor PgeF [Clostridia bacterium]
MNFSVPSCDGFSVTVKKGVPFITDNRIPVPHGFSTRHGGVSRDDFESFNLAYSDLRYDSLSNVQKNYDILLDAFDVTRANAVRTNQLHTHTTLAADNSHGGTGFTKPDFEQGVDGLITNTPGLLLSIRMADCLPILLYDTKNRAVGAVHSGWKGTIDCIAPRATDKMCALYGTQKKDLLVSFGPSVAPCCYQVGEEFRENFILRHGKELSCAFEEKKDGIYADMRFINRYLLVKSGVPEENIAIYTPCTCCNPSSFFSYRRQKEQRGTMSAVIKLI